MALDREEHVAIDISSAFVVLTYTHADAKPFVLLARVAAGDDSNGITGGGEYQLDLKIDGAPTAPTSLLTVDPGITETVFQGRPVTVENGETLTVELTGLAGDLIVNIVTLLVDNTPAQAADISGRGATIVDHDYGGADLLSVTDPEGAGITGVVISAFLATDYASNNRSPAFIKGQSNTNNDGRWTQPMNLDAAVYQLVFEHSSFKTNVVPITVT
jgi:hypothetical protein